MKYYKVGALIIFTIFFSLMFGEEGDFRIISSETEKELLLPEFAEELAEYDVIFFGELHDDDVLHQIEAEILPYLYRSNPKIAISMEMFERDVQPVLDAYLENKITEEEFVKDTRAWQNYDPDYKSIIEFARENKLSVIAANVPRRYAKMLNKQGYASIEALPELEKSYLARELKVLDDEYKIKFFNDMTQNFGNKSPAVLKMIRNIYAAQCLKDDTMAESINNFLIENPDRSVIHYNGDFHSNSHLGTVRKLYLLNLDLKVTVLSPITFNMDEELIFHSDQKINGDYLILIHRKPVPIEEEEKMKMFKH